MRDLAHPPGALAQNGTRAQAIALEATSLGFRDAGVTILDDVSFQLPKGQTTVLMGANGAGKSVLLRVLHGLLRQTTGQVTINGTAMSSRDRYSQALVTQRPILLRRSVAANISFALGGLGLTRAERHRRLEHALHAARLENQAKAPARKLSGGEQQRLSLACALARAPGKLFLDEPTASLDPANTLAFEAQLSAAKGEDLTVLLVTHDAGQARRLGDHLVFLDRGRVAETGPLEQALDAPRSGALRAWLSGEIWPLRPDATLI